MKKLRLDLDALEVDTFAAEPGPGKDGTVRGHTAAQTDCYQTCNAFYNTCAAGGCSGELCTVDCTGLGSECYTDDPVYYDCTGQDPCTGHHPCTNTTCTGYC